MARVEIRDYQGDFKDVAEFFHRVWSGEYGGKTWFPIPNPAFMRWRVGPESGGFNPVAYRSGELVGSVFSFPHCLRIGETVFPVSISTGFTVDDAHRGVALQLVQRFREEIEERGIAFGIGLVFDDPTTPSYRFWTKYAQTFPQNFRIVFKSGFWAKFLEPHALARAGIKAWERIANRTLGPLLRFTPHKYDPHVRPYRAGDLDRCTQMLKTSTAGFDWAMAWQPEQLSAQLRNPAYETLVFERDGQVQGMVNYHSLPMQGRELVQAAMIDLWADEGLGFAERVRLLSHLCTHLAERGVHAVIAPRSAMMPAGAFVANLFMPAPQGFFIGVFSTSRSVALSPPKTWDLTII